jgi:hypothetical protein
MTRWRPPQIMRNAPEQLCGCITIRCGKGAGVEGQTELELLEDSISVAVIRLER